MASRSFPHFEEVLPALAAFCRQLGSSVTKGELDSAKAAHALVDEFLTPERKAEIRTIVPDLDALIACDGGITLRHVLLTIASLPDYAEYRDLERYLQTVITWALFFHDMEKRASHRRDRTHAFQSAVKAAQNLPRLGLELPDSYHRRIDEWARLTLGSVIDSNGIDSQDNEKLPLILDGIDEMFERDSSPARIVKVILLHHSINALADWPQDAALNDREIAALVDPLLIRLLRIFLLADSDGWELFNPENRGRYHAETRTEFTRLQNLVGHKLELE